MLTAVQIVWNVRSDRTIKLEKILKDSLDLIPSPSPSVKIQIIGGNYWQELGKKLLDDVNNFFVFKSFVAQQCFDFTPQDNFPAHNLNFQ